MMQQENVDRRRRQRKFLLVVPLIVLPFAAFLLWSVGVLGSPTDVTTSKEVGALNMQLPEADTRKDKLIDKMGVYLKGDKDSAKYLEALKSDPYYRNKYLDTLTKKSITPTESTVNSVKDDQDNNELRVSQKLRELNEVLNARTPSQPDTKTASYQHLKEDATVKTADVDRLEKMLNSITNKDSGNDPEMQQLNQVMEKMLDVQHPARVEEKLRQNEIRGMSDVYSVTLASPSVISYFGQTSQKDSGVKGDSTIIPQNGGSQFYSLDTHDDLIQSENAIAVTIFSTQTLMNGSTVKLKLIHDIAVKGVIVPKETFVFGRATLNGERLQIVISTINFHHNILPVSLTAYDMDGIAGVYVPGAVSRDVLKQSGDQAFQTMGLTSLDPSIGAQVAGAGIETAKRLITKKIKLIKVVVKDGYELLLKSK